MSGEAGRMKNGGVRELGYEGKGEGMWIERKGGEEAQNGIQMRGDRGERGGRGERGERGGERIERRQRGEGRDKGGSYRHNRRS